MKYAIIVSIAVSILLIVGISIAQKDLQLAPDNTKEMPKEIIGKDGAKMVLIPAGEFEMGTDPAEIPELVKLAKDQGLFFIEAIQFEDEAPRHTVYVDAFYMDAYEVTNAQYRKFVQATGHRELEGFIVEDGIIRIGKPWESKNYKGDNQPVVCVSWDDAKAYADWSGKRLPTEAEWEYSARGGLVGKRYAWGDDWPPPKGSGNFADGTLKRVSTGLGIIDGYDDGYAYTAPVGSYKPNSYGLYDMLGNVLEWCADWYDEKYYVSSPKSNPKGPDSGQFCILRGGSWSDDIPFFLRLSDRNLDNPNECFSTCGFRCVVSATP